MKIAQIDWIEASDYYSRLHIGGKTHLLRLSFCRIHRSTIVNLDRVCGLELNENGEHDVLLEDGTRHRLSRSQRSNFRSLLEARTR